MRADFRLLLTVTAIVETTTGLGLVVWPEAVFTLLLGMENAATETRLVGRIAGAAIMSIGVSSWLVRGNPPHTTESAVVSGIGIYTVVAAALLTYAGTSLSISGVALWPAVIFHSLLGAWCLYCLGRTYGFTSGRSSP